MEQNKIACEIISRIHTAYGIEEKHGSLKELAPKLRVRNGSTISGWKSKETGVPQDKIVLAAFDTGYLEHWIKTGEGPMKNEQSVGDGVQIGDSVEAEVIRGGRVIKEGGPTKALLDEAINHLSFIGANDKKEFLELTQEIKVVYDLVYKSIRSSGDAGE